MTEFIKGWAPFIVPLLLQTLWLARHIGQLEQSDHDQNRRLKRLENIQDEKLVHLRG